MKKIIITLLLLTFNVKAVTFKEIEERQCIPPKVKKEVMKCPKKIQIAKKKRLRVPKARLKEVKRRERKKKEFQKGPAATIQEALEQERRSSFREKREKRQLKLLEREATYLVRLIRSMPDTDKRKPETVFRLAELFIEKMTYFRTKARLLDEPIWQAEQKKKKFEARRLRRKQKKYEAEERKWREEAIKTYAIIVKRFPDYERLPDTLFFMAFALEEMNRHAQARRVYRILIKDHPTSKFIPNAYLSFAEYFFHTGEMDKALKYYQKVAEYEKSNVYGFSLYKQAWCYYNLQNFKMALQRFNDVIEFANAHPERPAARSLARQAKMELVLTYFEVGSPTRAWDYFRRIGGKDAEKMLERLAEIYFDKGSWKEAILVYHKLIDINPKSEKVCKYQVQIANATISFKPKPEQVREVERLISLYHYFRKWKKVPKEAKKECRREIASMLIYLATHWHREAVGTETQPGTKDKNTMMLAGKVYKLILKHFKDLDTVEFPDLEEKDRPTYYRIAYYYAELLFKQKRWRECGPAFDRVVELNPKGEYLADAAYASVICYDKYYVQTLGALEKARTKRVAQEEKKKKKKEEIDFSPKEIPEVQLRMLDSYNRYICYIPGSEDLTVIKYRKARIYYENNHFQEAAVLFKDIAYNHSAHELGTFAANLYLDSLNILARENPNCYETLEKGVVHFLRDPNLTKDEQFKRHMRTLRVGTLRKRAEALQKQGFYKDAALLYVRIFETFQDLETEKGRLDETLYNAAINFEAARLLGAAIRVRKILINKFPDSHNAHRAIYQLGGNYHALAMYSKAAHYYEIFAEKYAGEKEAPEALMDATFFRLGRGEDEKALANAELFLKNWGKRRGFKQQASQVFFAVGTVYEDRKDWDKVIAHYQSYLKRFKGAGVIDEIIQAYVAIGFAYWNKKDYKKARTNFETAIKLYGDGTAKARVKDEDKDKRALRIAKMMEAVSKARFHIAEQSYREFKAIKFPEFDAKKKFRGKDAVKCAKLLREKEKEKKKIPRRFRPRLTKKERQEKQEKERFECWLKIKFEDWYLKKREKIESTKKLYEKTANLNIPHWVIASAARVGEMYQEYMQGLYDAPVPPDIRKDQELYDIYRAALDQKAQPYRDMAIGAYEFCLKRSTEVRWFNEYSTLCEKRLNKLDPARFPIASEIRSSPGFMRQKLVRADIIKKILTKKIRKEKAQIAGTGE